MPTAQVDRASPPARWQSSSDWPGRTPPGATDGSRVSWDRDGSRPCSLERLGHLAAPRHRPFTDAHRPDLDRVPAFPGIIDAGLRLLLGRHGAVEAALRAVLHRARHPTGVRDGDHGSPDWIVGF